ncbi:hypothetical protein [Streptomyces sp. NPDC006971]|uniref:hypothetical protein n=1 Tax=Streptomyces sp. NPDC006971 TaxID=3154784 RepID=UPI00340A72B2
MARVVLRAAMEAARKNGGGQKAKSQPRPVRTVRREGREPTGLEAAIGALVTERAWELPAAGASLREQCWRPSPPSSPPHQVNPAITGNGDFRLGVLLTY